MEKLIPELFFPLLKRHQQSYTLFLDLSWFLGGPNLENQAKTLYCRQKSKVPPFLKKRELFTKRWKNDTQSDPERQEKAIKNATREPLETHSKKAGKKTPKKLAKNPPAFDPERSGAPPPPDPLPISKIRTPC